MNVFAIFIGAFLLIEGFSGLTSSLVVGFFSTNLTHAITHIVLGILGIVTGISGRARPFCIFLGVLLLAVGVLWFVPGLHELLVRLLNVNRAVAVLNIVIGVIALALAFLPAGGSSKKSLG